MRRARPGQLDGQLAVVGLDPAERQVAQLRVERHLRPETRIGDARTVRCRSTAASREIVAPCGSNRARSRSTSPARMKSVRSRSSRAMSAPSRLCADDGGAGDACGLCRDHEGADALRQLCPVGGPGRVPEEDALCHAATILRILEEAHSASLAPGLTGTARRASPARPTASRPRAGARRGRAGAGSRRAAHGRAPPPPGRSRRASRRPRA